MPVRGRSRSAVTESAFSVHKNHNSIFFGFKREKGKTPSAPLLLIYSVSGGNPEINSMTDLSPCAPAISSSHHHALGRLSPRSI
jgi:hypothetical protein